MVLRAGLPASATLFGLCGLLPNQVHAGLRGAGNTVQAFYYNPATLTLLGSPLASLIVLRRGRKR